MDAYRLKSSIDTVHSSYQVQVSPKQDGSKSESLAHHVRSYIQNCPDFLIISVCFPKFEQRGLNEISQVLSD